ncbi:hypothetical protein LTR10_016650 [Elasticomyces elasticus]|uniref:FAD/NAD(P)-binding domain-containing protein n=1 Tax=Exophiala sideris TaxID=1016849 RepID=A0ABR0JJQ9_9EURO|nr:hypothetical protein LTR10_016650 [Elasticomyces elasticus]KAK5035296.1 hypothetical protein LTS07_002732 [Exophiala sideris]KAK5039352.1 hypothetical protein LTR13_003609 [Exophiala sideris]KAK5066220.1 hypothetical protein LTR69_002738 [Exophiala sideris]KAK5186897.1 hypothetical protein LTR44_000903 [Eurotiomycetes sp. CCFEE 6388]
MPLKKDISNVTPFTQNEHSGPREQGLDVNGHGNESETLDMVIVGAGFAGVYLLHQLRKRGFKAKIVEAGSDLGGIWYWNRYPGARVDSQYPVYALSIPEVYRDWTWSSHYPDHAELREYFEHIENVLHVKKDCVFNAKVVAADWDDTTCLWTIKTETGQTFKTKFWTACTGFAAKRYFPDWEGLDDYKGVIHHSSFWPKEGVNVKGKRVAVIGTGATGVQITQEWCREIGEDGHLEMWQRTPNFACAMNQVYMTKDEQEKIRDSLAERFADRNNYYNGFLYQWRDNLTHDHDAKEREDFYWTLWKLGGFRFLMNNYYDMTRENTANQKAYDFWRDRVRDRVKDERKAELLAPTERPHLFGGKRLSLEQDFYDHFNKPNVDVVDVRNNPIKKFVSDGIIQEDGTYHKLDIIALATGFDSITGGLKDMKITGVDGDILAEKWAQGTWTYLGMTTAKFPNFFFTYGPQAPTAFSNGPSCIEIQGDWITEVLSDLREQGKKKMDADRKAEEDWRALVFELINDTPRGKVDSWYNGANIPGKPREHLNYAGGIPRYKKTLEQVRKDGFEGFTLS